MTTPFRIALTFDAEHADRPHHLVGSEDRIRETLGKLGVPATFFVQGRWAEAFPDRARRIADDGHLIGSHSHYHAPTRLLTDAGLHEDLKAAQGAIQAACGRDPVPWFRSPFGAGAGDAQIGEALAELGYRNVLWNVSGDDWDQRRTARQVADEVVANALAHGDWAIVLYHTWSSLAHGTLKTTIKRLRDGGARFVTVDALDPAAFPLPFDW